IFALLTPRVLPRVHDVMATIVKRQQVLALGLRVRRARGLGQEREPERQLKGPSVDHRRNQPVAFGGSFGDASELRRVVKLEPRRALVFELTRTRDALTEVAGQEPRKPLTCWALRCRLAASRLCVRAAPGR